MNDTHEEAGQADQSQTGFREAAFDATYEAKEPRQALKDLLSFHLGLGRPKDWRPYEGVLVPALIAPYRDLSEIRYDYPLCILKNGEDALMPLGNIFNQLIDEVGGDSDSERRLQYYLQKLEFSLKSLSEEGKHGLLSDLWVQAADNLYSKLDMDDPKNIQLKEDLDSLKQGLDVDGNVIGCNKETPLCVLYAIWKANLREKGVQSRDTLAKVSIRLENILAADTAKSESAYTPEELEKTIGSADLDFSELSKILSPHVAKDRMASKRRQRIEKVLDELKKFQGLYELTWDDVKTGVWTCDSIQAQGAKPAKALTQIDKHMEKVLSYLKALQIAKLEAEGAYRDEHDAFFADFGWNHVTDEAMAMCPPIVLALRATDLKSADRAVLLDVLSKKLPLKVALIADDLSLAWLDKLGEMAMSLQDVFVLQAASNNLPAIASRLQDGIDYSGPALFYLFTGEIENSVSPYLASAAALESRAFPSFVYDPANGSTWAQRLSIEASSDYSQDWPVSSFAFQGVNGQEISHFLPFSYAEFLAIDPRFASHFMWTPQSAYHDNMILLHEYLELDPGAAKDKVPYLLMVDGENTVHRVVADWEVVLWTLQVRGKWRRLQELGGVNNSHVLRLLKEEKQRLELQKQEEMGELEQNYREQMEQHVGDVAETVIDKIAAGLLGFTSATAIATPTTATATAPEPETEPEVAPIEEVEEEEAITIDDPYIETPRCTTCNECTNLNKQMFAYNENKQALIKDPSAGTFRELVIAAEKCPAKIIHPGKPLNPNEDGIEGLIERAKPFN